MDYFTGKALEYEVDEDDEFDEDDDDDQDGDSSVSGSGMESESDGYVPARGGPPKARRPAGAGGNTNPEECKQQ